LDHLDYGGSDALTFAERAEFYRLLEDAAPGEDDVEGYVDSIGKLKILKTSILSSIWGPFRKGDEAARAVLDELSIDVARLRPHFVRDATSENVRRLTTRLVDAVRDDNGDM
jgi:hypothetical protein